MDKKKPPATSRWRRLSAIGLDDPSKTYDFSQLPAVRWLRYLRRIGEQTGTPNPFFKMHDGRAGATTSVAGRDVVNFASYDYLGLSGHPQVKQAAKAAIDQYGTSVSASRLIAGERPVHRELETRLAKLHGTEDAIAFVSGHATNVTVIGQLLGKFDIILADALIHNSVQEGARLSGATFRQFAHNDLDALERLLQDRDKFQRALIVVEGVYSMDGDSPDLERVIQIKNAHDCWLMVDEAHSSGVLGASGRGIAEEQNIDPRAVEIWMGTLSKAFASTGGYIAGSLALTEMLRAGSPGFVFSVGLAPAQSAAACAAIDIMLAEPQRLMRLRGNANRFLRLAKALELDVGNAQGFPIIPVRVGDMIATAKISNRLLERGFNVPPVIFPAVSYTDSRLRFFISAEHEDHQIDAMVHALSEEIKDIKPSRFTALKLVPISLRTLE